ncbi:protein OPAQUE1-like isoform X3 [Ananas comosus]|uniref:Protein OPAQUE1-like isoform X3 n=1 Tax=Ananas comosus TaxID=4615 RepID=A0A6P5G956_ANACO|nr:protein OPAQUE1-like isoform X3 [Ananas comosus]
MALRRGSAVWVEDKECAWAEAEVVDPKEKLVVVVTPQGKKINVTAEKLLPRDADADHGGVDDMTKLTYLNEPGVLFNLARRYALNEIYTYTGSILIAVNPFTRLPHLYNAHMMEQYKGVQFGELSPHVFAVADASYRAMMNEGRSQSVLVSGESGAGKTETTKLIMQYLTYVGGHAAGHYRTVEQQVLESNPLLEAFGNARTVRNNNSSRFGKFVEIQFDKTGRISGAAIRTYLLERSRVVQITDTERNYHCFYQLCASGKDAEKYRLAHPRNFHYLNQSSTYELEGNNSAEEYLKTRRAMDIVGISLVEQEAVFRTLAAILHLGNIEFSPGEDHDSSVIKDEKSNFHLQMAAELLMLVDNVNKSVGQDLDSRIQIGVLDIYGFECFKHNSFEQFCINFANEKLQQHFNEHVFKMEQEEYRKEEINWSYIEFVDNQDILDLIEKKPIGIISLLDEACMFPRSTNKVFSTKLYQNFRGHPRFEKPKFSETDFALSHYAGKVTYQTDSFLEKNRDYVVVEHCGLLSSSRCSFISGLFDSQPEDSRSSYKFSSVASRFKQQLQALMETLNSTEPHYIRCVKPNSLNCPQKFENWSVLHQLRCGGVLEAIRISLAGYPTRRTYSEFIDRFGILAPEFLDDRFDEKSLTEKIIKKLKLNNFQLGKTKVFLRAGQIALLDSRRAEILDKAARIIQDFLRTFLAHKEFLLVRKAAVSLQAYCRGYLARGIYACKKETAAALLVQKYTRGWIHRRLFLHLYSAVLVIQSSIRGFSSRKRFMDMKKHRAAIVIQAQWRMWKICTFFQQFRRAAISVQCGWRQKLAKRELRRLKYSSNEAGALREAKNKLEKNLEDLTLRLTLEKRLRVAVEESKDVEISKLQRDFECLRAELEAANLETLNERNKNILLKQQLEISMNDQDALRNMLAEMEQCKNENLVLKSTLESLSKRNSEMEQELLNARKCSHDTLDKLQDVETRYLQLRQSLQNLENKLSNLDDENHILRQKALSLSPRNNLAGAFRPFSENYLGPSMLSTINQRSYSLTDLRRTRMNIERHEEHHEFLLGCIKEDLGFKAGKPIAACLIYKWLHQWGVFEAERTSIFDYIIEALNSVLKVESENDILPYWLANTSTLLCLLQRNLRSNVFPSTPSQHSSWSLVLSGKTSQVPKSPSKNTAQEESLSHVDARYPAMLFKQQLTACLEKIFGLIRDNLKREISPLLSLCIQAPKATRGVSGRRSRSPEGSVQQPLSTHWDRIIKFLDSLMDRLHKNFVPSFFIRKLITQVFSFINIQLFNSLLLRRECCAFSNGEYVKSGLAVLEKWITDATEEYAGAAWDELNYIRQAVEFLVIHQKRKKTLKEIKHDICPALSVRQIYRICTMYWDDKYSTQSVSSEVVATMRDMVNKDSQNLVSNSFLLDDDLSIPFSTEEISKSVPAIDPTEIELPPSLHHIQSAQFLIQQDESPVS